MMPTLKKKGTTTTKKLVKKAVKRPKRVLRYYT